MENARECHVSSVRPISLGSTARFAAQTVITAFENTVRRYPNHPALRTYRAGEWKEWTWQSYLQECERFACACISVGHARFESVAILGFNCPEWMIANVGAILAGGIPTGIYTTNGAEACEYVVRHANASIVVVENMDQLCKLREAQKRLTCVKAYVVWGEPDTRKPGQAADDAFTAPVYSWQDFIRLGTQSTHGTNPPRPELVRRKAAQTPENVCTLVYTSGTIGMPKAVMISHDNITFTAASVVETFRATEADRMVSYLPLSHIAAAMLDIYGPIVVGYCISFAGPDALKGGLATTLKAVRPTIFFGVPRVYEKIQERMLEIGANSVVCVRALSRWAKRIGKAATAAEEAGQPAPWGYTLAKILVYGNVRRALGLQYCRAMFSAAAPMQPDTLLYFASLDMPVHEVYGMSESCGPATANMPHARKTFTCGKPFPGMEVAIFPLPAADKAVDGGEARPALRPLPPGTEGEVCMRGRHVFVSYKDDTVTTSSTIDSEGWLHSGDIGVIDAEGYLRITGRAKELIKTTGGENIPPVLIENNVRELLPVASHAVLVGDRRKYLVALIALKCKADPITGSCSQDLDDGVVRVLKGLGCHASTIEHAINDPRVIHYVQERIDEANKRAISHACIIQKFRLLPVDLSVDQGHLTATLKLKRSVILRQFSDLIDDMYRGDN